MTGYGERIKLLVIFVPIGLFFAWLGWGMYYNWIVNLEYQREIGKYFTYADRASDAPLKAKYFNQYVDALEKNGLNEGTSSVFFQEQPNADLAEHFKVAKSLQSRLNNVTSMNPTSLEYQQGLYQMTLQEFCWFPVEPFEQGYSLRHGAWGDALTPNGAGNRC